MAEAPSSFAVCFLPVGFAVSARLPSLLEPRRRSVGLQGSKSTRVNRPRRISIDNADGVWNPFGRIVGYGEIGVSGHDGEIDPPWSPRVD